MTKEELCELIQKTDKHISHFVYTPFNGKPGYTEYRILSYDINTDFLMLKSTGEIRSTTVLALQDVCATQEQAIAIAIRNIKEQIKYMQELLNSLEGQWTII